MTKSTITRERLAKIKSWRETYGAGSNVMLPAEEAEELARMALSAMDSESECLPLDYLQGHKDGLEWAAQLAEANHPETGDWLYDDPIELAKAIRKGPDMPPAQPAADSEPDRNPVLAYADSYRDMAKQGVESVPIWSVITDLERNIAPLYRHAQPAPVSYSDFEEFWSAYIHPLAQDDELKGFAWDIWSVLGSNSQPAPVVPEEVTAEDCPALVKYDVTEVDEAWARGFNSCRAAMLQAYPVCTCPSGDGSLRRPCPVHPGNSPTQSDCCPAQNSVTPAQNQGWIPVSERMPEAGVKVLCFPVEDEPIHAVFNGQLWLQDISWSGSDEPIDNVIPTSVTHWMPLPAAPQEVKP